MNGMPKAHTPHEALIFAGRIAQLLPPELTSKEMDQLMRAPSGRLKAFLAGLPAVLADQNPQGHEGTLQASFL